jgi:hypothetical protein
MAKLMKLEVMGYRDTKGRFTRRTEELNRARRDEMRELGRGMVHTLQYYAPEDTGKFKQGIAYRTDDRVDSTTITFYVKGEHAFLLPIITGGSEPHEIPKGGSEAQMAKGYPLAFFWQRGPEGPGMYYYYSVQHPGTIPNPFVSLAIDAESPQFSYRLSQMARRVVWL